MKTNSKPVIFREVLWELQAPDLFNVILSEKEIDQIYEQIVKDTKMGDWPENFLQWRDATFDAMEKLNYELS